MGRCGHQVACDFHSGSAHTDLPDDAVAQEMTVCAVGVLKQDTLSPVTRHLEPDLAIYNKPRRLEGDMEALEGVTEVRIEHSGISAPLFFQRKRYWLLMSEVVF